MPTPENPITQLLQHNPSISLAYLDNTKEPEQLHIYYHQPKPRHALLIPPQLLYLHVIEHETKPFNTLICPPLYQADPQSCFQCCQNPPIQLGTQIQPHGANWVGTAGSPAAWTRNGTTQWGLLTNYHVAAMGNPTPGRPIHQPTALYPQMAQLTDFVEIHTDRPNRVDAAICDSLTGDYHSVAPDILEIGPPTYPHVSATVGLQVVKAGRTTGLTTGRCQTIGASVRVNYGQFTAIFQDQDVYAPTSGTFSAPGDSGSLILSHPQHQPTSLLFAGNGELTIGNPMRHVVASLNLLPRFP